MGKQAIRVVSTGKEGVVYNGLSDWLYEGKGAGSAGGGRGLWLVGRVCSSVFTHK